MLPRIGPARPTRASASALSPSEREKIIAPRNGTNIGALALIPSRRSWNTWPISCRNSSTTNPAANSQPKKMLYAATDTSAVPAVTNSLALGSSRTRPLIATQNFAIAAPTAASMLPIRLRNDCVRERRWVPNGSSPAAGAGARTGTAGTGWIATGRACEG